MNKKLRGAAIALAMAGAFTTSAQAQTSVTVYGIADGTIRFDRTNAGTLTSVGSGGASGSRWGLRGMEDLGGGLRANFLLEQGFDLSTNDSPQNDIAGRTPSSPTQSTGSRLFSRSAWVGLSGNFGSLRLGRDYSPFFNTWAAADPFGTGMVGQLGQESGRLGSVTRLDNGIYYDTPGWSGFKASAAISLGESTTDNATATKRGGDIYNVGLTYGNGPVYVGYSYLEQKNATETDKRKAHTLVGTYDFTAVKVHGLFWQNKTDSTGLAAGGGYPGSANVRAYSLGFTVPVGAFAVLAGATRLDDRSAANTDYTFYGLGALYALSKRTDTYASYGRMNNKNGASNRIGDANGVGLQTAANVPGGFKPSALQVGVRHRF